MEQAPTVIACGNTSEIIALAGGASRGQGVDSRDDVDQAEDAARLQAEAHGATIAVTGAVDFVTDGDRAARIEGGSALMPRVTALGCSLTCLIGAFAAIRPAAVPCAPGLQPLPPFLSPANWQPATRTARARSPWRFLDALAALDAATRRSPCQGGRGMRNLDLSLYLVLDPGLCAAFGMVETARAAVAGGATMVQLRDKHADTARMIETGRGLKVALAGTGAC